MSNHVHLLIEAGEKGSISKIMQGITLAHTRYFNLKYKTSGHVWQGRFKSPIVGEDSYLLESKQIHRVKSGKGRQSKDAGGISVEQLCRACIRERTPLIEDHVYYDSLGKTKEERRTRCKEFVKERFREEKLKEIRESVVSGKGYGSDEYLQKVEESIKTRLRKGRRGRPKKKDV